MSLSTDTVSGTPPDIQPDTQMAAGPQNLVEVVNAGELTVWSRTGTLIVTRDLNVEFSVPLGSVLADSRILFDAESSRWFVSSFAFDSTTNTSIVYLAVSASADPTAVWRVTTVVNKATTLTDQPKVGVASDKAVLSWSDFDLSIGAPGTYAGAETWVFTKSNLLAGTAPPEKTFGPDPLRFDLVPAQALEASSTAYLAYNDGCGGPAVTAGTCTTGINALGVVAVTGTPTANNVTWTNSNPDMGVPTSFPPSAVQLGAAPLLSAGDDRLLSAVWRNGTLWAAGNDACTPVGDTVARSCFKVIEASTVTSPISVVQTLDIGSLGGYLLYPAVTVDAAGEMFAAGSLSSATQFPSVVAFSLAPGPTGALSEVTVQAGAGPYDCSCSTAPWGEYSAAALDPVSANTIWVAGEYGTAVGGMEWGTVIGEISPLSPSTTTLASSLNPSVLGGSVTLTATVSPTSATGTVTFMDGAVPLGAPTLSGGTASVTTSTLTAGTHLLIARYVGDTNNAPSASLQLIQVVTLPPTSTSLTSSANPSRFGQPVTLTATETPLSATGVVDFMDGALVLGSASLSNGIATFTTSTLSVGTHPLTAAYGGDSNNAASVSLVLSQFVQTSTSSSLTSSLNPSVFRQSVTLTGTVTPSSATGSVTFKDGALALGVVNLNNGIAIFTTSTLSVGTHPLTAVYSGDTNNAASVSTGLSQVVNQAPTSTSLTSSLNPSVFQQSVTLTATVSPVSATGSVTFKDGALVLGVVNLNNGLAIFTTSTLSVGTHPLTAVYSGDTNNAASVSPVVPPQVVNQAPTSAGIVMDAYGGLHPFGIGPVNTAGAPYWPGFKIARGVAMITGGSGGYLLDGWGGIHPFGAAPPVPGTAYWQGWDIARGIVLNPCAGQPGGYVLDGFGGVHPFGGAPPLTTSGYWPGWDIAKALAVACTGTVVSGYVLDGFGGVHNFSSNGVISTPVTTAYWGGWNIARGIVVSGVGQGYVLDGFGGLHPFGGAPAIAASSYWSGWDIARGIAYDSIGGGYVLDGWGGLHRFGNAPSVSTGAYWPGWDIARGVITG